MIYSENFVAETVNPALKLNIMVAALAYLAFFATSFGLLRTYSIPTNGMRPAISQGDTVFMEGFTYLFRPPEYGEILVYKTDGIPALQEGAIYSRRLVGKPGDKVRISNGKLYVNDKHLPLSNANGPIVYCNFPTSKFLTSSMDTATVPERHYFVLGDNSQHSSDSRIYGFVPARNVLGRIVFR